MRNRHRKSCICGGAQAAAESTSDAAGVVVLICDYES